MATQQAEGGQCTETMVIESDKAALRSESFTEMQLSKYKRDQGEVFAKTKGKNVGDMSGDNQKGETATAASPTKVEEGPSCDDINLSQPAEGGERIEDVITEVIRSFQSEGEFNYFAVHRFGLRLSDRELQNFRDDGLSSYARQRRALGQWCQLNGHSTPADLRKLFEDYIANHGEEYKNIKGTTKGKTEQDYGPVDATIGHARKLTVNSDSKHGGARIAVDTVDHIEFGSPRESSPSSQSSVPGEKDEKARDDKVSSTVPAVYMRNVNTENLITDADTVVIAAPIRGRMDQTPQKLGVVQERVNESSEVAQVEKCEGVSNQSESTQFEGPSEMPSSNEGPYNGLYFGLAALVLAFACLFYSLPS